jgi:hypothetical protein
MFSRNLEIFIIILLLREFMTWYMWQRACLYLLALPDCRYNVREGSAVISMDELQFAASQGECEALCDQVKHSIQLYAINTHFQIHSTVCLLILLHVFGYPCNQRLRDLQVFIQTYCSLMAYVQYLMWRLQVKWCYCTYVPVTAYVLHFLRFVDCASCYDSW